MFGNCHSMAIGGEVLVHVERQLGVERRRDGLRGDGVEADRVAVGRRAGDGLGADIAGRAALVLDDELLAGELRQRWQPMRESMSVAPPGGKMPMKRIGPFGQMPWAMPGAASSEAPAASAARRVNPSFPAIPQLPGRDGLAPVITARVSRKPVPWQGATWARAGPAGRGSGA